MPKLEPKIRPGAGGHRFGPDLQCSECGRYWDAHQQNPRPCATAVARSLAIAAAIEEQEVTEECAREEIEEELELP